MCVVSVACNTLQGINTLIIPQAPTLTNVSAIFVQSIYIHICCKQILHGCCMQYSCIVYVCISCSDVIFNHHTKYMYVRDLVTLIIHTEKHLMDGMLEVAKQQVCACVLYVTIVQRSLYFQHNSCSAHAVLQLLYMLVCYAHNFPCIL